MAVIVAVPDTAEGRHALLVAVEEARQLATDLVVLNLSAHEIEVPDLPVELSCQVVDRLGPGDRDPAKAVLDEIDQRPEVTRLVIGVRRRSPVGKALLGSLSQRLLLDSPVPVLAVKVPDED